MKKLIITSTIIVLSTVLSFAQNPEYFGREYRLFKHALYENAGKKHKITGIWSTKEIDRYNIMCVSDGMSAEQYIFICSESQSNAWTTSLEEMKALFLKNDKIAKENNVSTPITKNISDKFTFKGLYGAENYNGPILKQYDYNRRGRQAGISVLYKYIDGCSSMELCIDDFYTQSSKTLWEFNSVEDFDIILNALNWTNFMNNFNKQVKEYQDQLAAEKAAAEKAQSEGALFD